jgi:HK97 family phage prohead protease
MMDEHELLLAAAAAERAKAVVTRADRPGQRRCASEPDSRAWLSAPHARMQLRGAADGTGPLHFTGYASVYEQAFEMWDWFGPYTEIVTAGAGALSLARPDLDVPLVLQHSSLRRIARTTNGTLTLVEDDNGLLTDAPALDRADHDVAYIAPKLFAGLLDEMSFMFRINAGQWSPDYTEFRINEYDIHRGDTAIVGYGANPFTAGAGLRSAQALEVVRSLDEPAARAALAELRSRLEPPAPPKRGCDVVTTDDELLLALR